MKPRNATKRLICALAGMALIATQTMPAWATDDGTTTKTDTEIVSNVITITNDYDDFGVCYATTQKTNTKQTTTKTETKNGKTTTTKSTTTSESVVKSSWKGGSVKTDTVTGTSETKGDDGSTQTTNSTTNYTYDDQGRLQACAGTTTVVGKNAKQSDLTAAEAKAEEKSVGSYTSTIKDTYEIKNGQAVLVRSEGTGTSISFDGTVTADTTTTTTYENSVSGGEWHVDKMIENSTSKNRNDAGCQDFTKTTTYTRNDKGVITDMKVTAVGTMTQVGTTGGVTNYKLTSYTATIEKPDGEHGWRISSDTQKWEKTDASSSSDSNGSTTNSKKIKSVLDDKDKNS